MKRLLKGVKIHGAFIDGIDDDSQGLSFIPMRAGSCTCLEKALIMPSPHLLVFLFLQMLGRSYFGQSWPYFAFQALDWGPRGFGLI